MPTKKKPTSLLKSFLPAHLWEVWTLRTVLFTNSNRDFGGESGWLAPLLNPKRRFVRNLVKKDERFYVDSVMKTEYLRVYVTGYANHVYCTGHKNLNDFRGVEQDTIIILLCIQPVARRVEAVSY